MFGSWKQLLYCTLQARAYKEVKYVAAGSSCELIQNLEIQPEEDRESNFAYSYKVEVGLFSLDAKSTPATHLKPFIKASFVLPGGILDTEALDYRAVFNTKHQVYYMLAIGREPSHSTFDLSDMEWMGDRRRAYSKRLPASHEVQTAPLIPAVAQPSQHIGQTQAITQAAEGHDEQISLGTENLAPSIPAVSQATQYIEGLQATTQVVEGPHPQSSEGTIILASPILVDAQYAQRTGDNQAATQIVEGPYQPLSQNSGEQTATLLTTANSPSAILDGYSSWADEAEENGKYIPMSKWLTSSQTSSLNLPGKSNNDTEATGILNAGTSDFSTSTSESDSYSESRSTSDASTPEPPASPESEKASILSGDGAEEIVKLIDALPSGCNPNYTTPLDTIVSGSPSSWLETREHHHQNINEHVAHLDYNVHVPKVLSGYFDRLTSRWKTSTAPLPLSDSPLVSLETRKWNDRTLQHLKLGYFDRWHHLNYWNERIYQKSFTAPEVSLWMAHQNYNKEHFSRLTRQKVLASQAGKYIDRVRYSGPADILTLRGTALRDAVTGYVNIAYPPVGRWQCDLYASDESIPVYSDPDKMYSYRAFDRKGNEIVTFGPVGGYVMNQCDGNSVVNDDGRTPPVTLCPYRAATKERSPLSAITNIDNDDDVQGGRVQMLLHGRIESLLPLLITDHTGNGNKVEGLMSTRPLSPKALSFDRIYQRATILGSTTIIEEAVEDTDADDTYFYDSRKSSTESQTKENVDSTNGYNIGNDDSMDALLGASTEHGDSPSMEEADDTLSKGPTHYIFSQDVSSNSEYVDELPAHHDASVTTLFHTQTSTGTIQLPLAHVEGNIYEAEIVAEDAFVEDHSSKEGVVEDRLADEDIVQEYVEDDQKEQYIVEGDARKHTQAQSSSTVADISSTKNIDNGPQAVGVDDTDPGLLPSEDHITFNSAAEMNHQLEATNIPLLVDEDELILSAVEYKDTICLLHKPMAVGRKMFEPRVGLGKNHFQDQPLRCLLHRVNAVTSTTNTSTDEFNTSPLLSSFINHNLPFVECSGISQIPLCLSSNGFIIKKSTVSIGRMAKRLMGKCAGKG